MFSETEDKAIEICPTRKSWERNWMSKSKRLRWVVPKWHSRGRNKISWVCCYVSSLELAHIFGLLTSVIKIYCFYSSRAFKRFYSVLNMLDQILKFKLTETSFRRCTPTYTKVWSNLDETCRKYPLITDFHCKMLDNLSIW